MNIAAAEIITDALNGISNAKCGYSLSQMQTYSLTVVTVCTLISMGFDYETGPDGTISVRYGSDVFIVSKDDAMLFLSDRAKESLYQTNYGNSYQYPQQYFPQAYTQYPAMPQTQAAPPSYMEYNAPGIGSVSARTSYQPEYTADTPDPRDFYRPVQPEEPPVPQESSVNPVEMNGKKPEEAVKTTPGSSESVSAFADTIKEPQDESSENIINEVPLDVVDEFTGDTLDKGDYGTTVLTNDMKPEKAQEKIPELAAVKVVEERKPAKQPVFDEKKEQTQPEERNTDMVKIDYDSEIYDLPESEFTYQMLAIVVYKGSDKESGFIGKISMFAAPINEDETIVKYETSTEDKGIRIMRKDQPLFLNTGLCDVTVKRNQNPVFGVFVTVPKPLKIEARRIEGGTGGHIRIKDDGITLHAFPCSINRDIRTKTNNATVLYLIKKSSGETQIIGPNVKDKAFDFNGAKLTPKAKWDLNKDPAVLHVSVLPQ